MWKDYDLPSFIIIEGQKFNINTDWRNIIDIFECFNDNELTDNEKFDCILFMFYENYEQLPNIQKAIEYLYLFIDGNKKDDGSRSKRALPEIKLVDWSKDLPIIIPPVNKGLGYDVRQQKHLHWWTFLGAFYEIGECTFSTYVGIRYKIAKRKKLDDWEKDIYVNHKSEIDITQNKAEYDNFDDEDILMKMARERNKDLIE